MSENAFHKTVCTGCGGHVEYPEESEGATVPCPHCGKNLFLYRAVRAVGTPPVKQNDFAPNPSASTPILWNPMAAAYWSLIFSPAFGSFLHAKNAESLGRTKEAKTNMVWFYLSLAYLGFASVSGFIFPTIPDSAFRFPALIFYCCWFYVGEKQVKYVKATWQKNYQRKSWAAPLSIACGCLIVFIAACIVLSAVMPDGSRSTPNQSPTAQPESPSQQINYNWNTTDINATNNGNITVAYNWLVRAPEIRGNAVLPEPELVVKTPWNYFGKTVKLTGTVAVVQDYPARSDNFIESDIVMLCADGTAVEMLCMKPSGGVVIGDVVNLYGYPVGNLEVENRVGGKDTHLILVGNDYDNLGVAH